MLGISIALLITAQPQAPAASDQEMLFVSEIAIRTDQLSDREIVKANQYAACMAAPYFALSAEFEAKRAKCRKRHGKRKASARLGNLFAQVDHIVRGDPGSEASIKVTRKSSK